MMKFLSSLLCLSLAACVTPDEIPDRPNWMPHTVVSADNTSHGVSLQWDLPKGWHITQSASGPVAPGVRPGWDDVQLDISHALPVGIQ